MGLNPWEVPRYHVNVGLGQRVGGASLASAVMSARLRANTAALAAGSAFSGLLAYLFFALATRTVGPVEAAPLSVLWTYWSFAAAALTFPLQHWITRTVTAHGEGAVRRALSRVAATVLGISGVVGVLTWLIRDALFERDDAWFPVLVAAVTIGAGFVGVLRGGLAARHRFPALAWAIVAENAVRCVAAATLVVAGVRAAVGYGVCLVAGPLISVLWPTAFRYARTRQADEMPFPLAFLSGSAGGSVTSQVILTGGPVVLALTGGSAYQVTVLFAALALFRAPYTMALGMVSPLTGRLTLLVLQGNRAALRRIRVMIVLATAVAIAVAAIAGATAGPWLLRLIFGDDVELASSLAALVAVGSALALSNLVLTVAVMAQSLGGAVLRCWLAGAISGAVLLATVDTAALTLTCWAFVVAESVAWVCLLVTDERGSAKAPGRAAGSADGSGTVLFR